MMMRGKYAAAAAVLAGTCEGAFAASPALDKADVAWMLVATILVLFMTIPGIALFTAAWPVKEHSFDSGAVIRHLLRLVGSLGGGRILTGIYRRQPLDRQLLSGLFEGH